MALPWLSESQSVLTAKEAVFGEDAKSHQEQETLWLGCEEVLYKKYKNKSGSYHEFHFVPVSKNGDSKLAIRPFRDFKATLGHIPNPTACLFQAFVTGNNDEKDVKKIIEVRLP